MANNAAHNELVRQALEALALNGVTAWKNDCGVWFETNAQGDNGRPHKYGKKGSADIMAIIPIYGLFNGAPNKVGMHCEFEAKTGAGVQSKNQKLHQEFVVERNGGLYIVFRSVEGLLAEIQRIGISLPLRPLG